MKTLFLVTDLANNKGGIQVFNNHLIKALAELGNSLSVVSLNDNKNRGFRKAVFVINALRQVFTFKPQFILCGHINFSFFCLLLNKIFKIPYFTIAHGIEAWRLKGLKKIGLQHSLKVLSVSRFTKNEILKQLPNYLEKNIFVLPNTFNAQKFSPQPKSAYLMNKLSIKADDKIILTVARLSKQEKYKGYDLVIMAMKEIVKEIPNAKYIIVGSGSDEERIKALISDNNLEDKVILNGFIPHEEIVDYYNLCDVFVLPSSGEGFGIVFLEALACGKPVIAGNIDGSGDALLDGDIGFLVNPHNLSEIKAAIIKILKREVSERLLDGLYLRTRVLEFFSFDKFKERVSEIISAKVISSNSILRIKPVKGWVPIDLKELWRHRELLYFFIWREIKVRYKQTTMGATWAILQPFLMMVVFSLFFGRFMKVPREGIAYPLFSYAAILPWMLFAEGISRSTDSVIQNANLITKVYFPRLIMPLSGIISPLVDFGFAFLVFIGLMFYYGFPPTIKILLLPVFLLLALITALAVGLWFSAINVQYRDVRYTIPFLIQFWFFASPVVYSSASLPKSWQWIYGLNPMVGVIEGFRWILLGTAPPGPLMLVSLSIVVIILISGAFYFRRMEKVFADMV
ncbi:MAG: glycosyltransferase [Candidatus Omnitrophota bacterium]|nr:glycosyltransferase [Candidatus Omnitrophota bacterium]